MSNIEIFPKGESLPGDWFIGNAFLHPLVGKDKNNNFSAGNVSFEVNARTNWHTHPKEQVLLIIDGQGLYQEKGKPAKQIRKGDVINIPENIEHWHGASSTSQITHIAITNYEGDNQVNWLQPVSADEYSTANK
jgi:quercetin dioxygenase-like cupin family protein